MIDVHFHCLPDIDDGPATWQEAVDLCREAAAGGVTALVATPHVLRGDWVNEDPGARDQLILKLNTMLGGRPSVLAGCEYFFSADAVELWEKGKSGPLTGLNRTGYLLLEFPPGPISAVAAGIFHELSLLDVTPVIAHPERHRVFAKDPGVLEDLVRRGAVVQITAGSLLGHFGDGPLEACREFLRRGFVRVVASDAHSLAHRPPDLGAARALVSKTWGSEVENGLFEANPRAIIAGAALPWDGSRTKRGQTRTR